MEQFETIDENGNTVIVNMLRNIELTDIGNGKLQEMEKLPDLSVDGLGEVGGINDPVYQYKIMSTGMKLRDRK